MTREEFKQLPHLVQEADVIALGYSRQTVNKFVACGVLRKVKPAGTNCARFQKKQLAQMLRWEDLLEPEAFRREPPMMPVKAVHRWTGFSENTLAKISLKDGIRCSRPPGATAAKFLKADVAKLIGFEEYV